MKTTTASRMEIATRLFGGGVLLYAALLKLSAHGEYLRDFPLRQILPGEFLAFFAACLVAIEISVALECFSGRNKRENACMLLFLYGFFLLVSVFRLIPSINDFVFPRGCDCFPGGGDNGLACRKYMRI